MKFQQRIINLLSERERYSALAMITNLPVGENLQIVAREAVKTRTKDQNALMWSGALRDISEQAFVEGKQFSDMVWHEHFKREYLPELDEPYLAELVKDADSYKKWDYMPNGERVLVGSTTDLSKYGFGQYLEQIYANGANLGVMFRADERMYG